MSLVLRFRPPLPRARDVPMRRYCAQSRRNLRANWASPLRQCPVTRHIMVFRECNFGGSSLYGGLLFLGVDSQSGGIFSAYGARLNRGVRC